MKYLVHTIHRDAFEVEADEVICDNSFILFMQNGASVDDDKVACAIRFDHFKSALKVETIH
jgi:hypothetical protein